MILETTDGRHAYLRASAIRAAVPIIYPLEDPARHPAAIAIDTGGPRLLEVADTGANRRKLEISMEALDRLELMVRIDPPPRVDGATCQCSGQPGLCRCAG